MFTYDLFNLRFFALIARTFYLNTQWRFRLLSFSECLVLLCIILSPVRDKLDTNRNNMIVRLLLFAPIAYLHISHMYKFR